MDPLCLQKNNIATQKLHAESLNISFKSGCDLVKVIWVMLTYTIHEQTDSNSRWCRRGYPGSCPWILLPTHRECWAALRFQYLPPRHSHLKSIDWHGPGRFGILVLWHWRKIHPF